jgi:hypothetical protein
MTNTLAYWGADEKKIYIIGPKMKSFKIFLFPFLNNLKTRQGFLSFLSALHLEKLFSSSLANRPNKLERLLILQPSLIFVEKARSLHLICFIVRLKEA